jgi:signal transduction histidine kinase
MKHQHIFSYAYSLLVGVACLVSGARTPFETSVVLAILVFACLLGVRLLLILSGSFAWLGHLLLAIAFVYSLSLGAGLFPFAALLLAQGVLALLPDGAAAPVIAVGAALLSFVLMPPLQTILVMPLCVTPLRFSSYIAGRLQAAHAAAEARAEENDQLRHQLADQRRMIATTEKATRLAERNRLAARIHDQVGHGISGSILLLEGARLMMDKNTAPESKPDAALQAIQTATDNLRDTVDNIRAELRAERAQPSETGPAQIAAQLARFEAEHGILTHLETQGELSVISLPVWMCISENLTEALTNLLKHSKASEFTVSIHAKNKLAKVVFADNGAISAANNSKPGLGLSAIEERCAAQPRGLGLSAIEERCALVHGNCFFRSDPSGFSIIMTFTHLNA